MVAGSTRELLNGVAVPVSTSIFSSYNLALPSPIINDLSLGLESADLLGSLVEVDLELVWPDWRSLGVG